MRYSKDSTTWPDRDSLAVSFHAFAEKLHQRRTRSQKVEFGLYRNNRPSESSSVRQEFTGFKYMNGLNLEHGIPDITKPSKNVRSPSRSLLKMRAQADAAHSHSIHHGCAVRRYLAALIRRVSLRVNSDLPLQDHPSVAVAMPKSESGRTRQRRVRKRARQREAEALEALRQREAEAREALWTPW